MCHPLLSELLLLILCRSLFFIFISPSLFLRRDFTATADSKLEIMSGAVADGRRLWTGGWLLLEQILHFNPSHMGRETQLVTHESPPRRDVTQGQ